MFDIGFAELVLIGVVGLLVIGPERLPGAIRTSSMWLNQFKRGFNSMKRDIERELEVDSVRSQLNQANEQFKNQSEKIKQGVESSFEDKNPAQENDLPVEQASEPSTRQQPKDTGE